jgi:transketolase
LLCVADFGGVGGGQGIFSTFAAFQEMVISEITMARLNYCNVLCHFSHSGCDDMADNSCHFGLNNFFADNGVDEHQTTRLYFPADSLQLDKVVEAVFWDLGLRFLYSTRSKLPLIQKEDGSNFFGEGYRSASCTLASLDIQMCSADLLFPLLLWS